MNQAKSRAKKSLKYHKVLKLVYIHLGKHHFFPKYIKGIICLHWHYFFFFLIVVITGLKKKSYEYETLALGLIFIMVVVFFAGKSKNEAIARAWCETFEELLKSQFSQVGMNGQNQKLYSKEYVISILHNMLQKNPFIHFFGITKILHY